MLKALLKKQLLEIFYKEAKPQKGKKSDKSKPILMYIFVYLLIFASLGFIMYQMANLICVPFVSAGYTWLYFAIMSLVSIAVGVIGGVFSTYSSLYLAKDNDMLLSLPIKPRTILSVRLLGVLFTGIIFLLPVFAPALGAYYVNAEGLSAMAVFTPLLCIPALALIILCLSCLLGWLVALLSTKLKGKSYITVIISIGFFVGYYALYGQAYTLLTNMAANPQVTAVKVKRYLYPLYKMGIGAAGNLADMLICIACCLALCGAMYYLLSRTFLKIATATSSNTAKKTKLGKMNFASASSALLRKELKHFTSSATYMLNCALGTVMMLVIAIFLFVKSDMLSTLFMMLPLDGGLLALIAVGAMCGAISMNDITAPSVSLEGKNLWLLQSMPVSPLQVFKAKIRLHLLLTVPSAVIMAVAVLYVLTPSVGHAFLILAASGVYLTFIAVLGLCLNLKMPNLNWTNEAVPVKQSMPVMLCLLGGWALISALGVLYYFIRNYISATVFLVLVTAVFVAFTVALYLWLCKRGTRIFLKLSA